MYFHPTLLVPTVLDFSVRTLCTLTAPLVISRTFGISDDSHPFAYSLADFACSSASLLFVLPIETIRRRLQIQSRGGRQIETCVETQPRPYAGFSDALWRILTEEQSKPPRRRRRRSSKAKETAQEVVEDKGWFQATGIAQLYRGFGMGVSASAIVFMLSLMVGREEPDAGWAEL
jgi:fusion and transport protein UGO1